MSDAEPAWHLLPSRPMEFFNLEEGFTLPQLRGAYNRLIKRYKPESYPEEFQRVRSAYELLSQQLRYGDATPQSNPLGGATFVWEAATSKSIEPASDPTLNQSNGDSAGKFDQEKSPFETRNVDRRFGGGEFKRRPRESNSVDPLTIQNAKARYLEWIDREEKTPVDYYHLAVLSDVVDPQPHCFIRWILNGIAECDNDPGLVRLAQEYFAEETSVDEALAHAKLTSEYVRNDTYYSLTEKLWERVLRNASFSTFERELENCEGSLLDHLSYHQRVFYLKLLRIAIWRADNDWPERKLIEVGSLEQKMGAWADQELHFLDQIQLYKAHRSTFLSAGPLASRIDQAIAGYCINDEAGSDQTFIECQHILASSPEALMIDFPIGQPRFVAVRSVWDLIAREMTGDSSESLEGFNPETIRRRVHGLAYELQAEWDSNFYSNVFPVGLGILILADLLIVIYGLYRMIIYVFALGEFLLALVSLLLTAVVVVMSLVPALLLHRAGERLVAKYYRSMLRPKVLAFFETGGIRVEDVVQELKAVNDVEVQGEKMKDAEQFSGFVTNDWAVYFYATAHSLLKTLER